MRSNCFPRLSLVILVINGELFECVLLLQIRVSGARQLKIHALQTDRFYATLKLLSSHAKRRLISFHSRTVVPHFLILSSGRVGKFQSWSNWCVAGVLKPLSNVTKVHKILSVLSVKNSHVLNLHFLAF